LTKFIKRSQSDRASDRYLDVRENNSMLNATKKAAKKAAKKPAKKAAKKK
jgi:hypothetical protein